MKKIVLSLVIAIAFTTTSSAQVNDKNKHSYIYPQMIAGKKVFIAIQVENISNATMSIRALESFSISDKNTRIVYIPNIDDIMTTIRVVLLSQYKMQPGSYSEILSSDQDKNIEKIIITKKPIHNE